MRIQFIIIAAILFLMALACKKQSSELLANKPVSTTGSSLNEKSLCFGNYWTADQQYHGRAYAPVVTYNNKVYFFNKNVNIVFSYDGTNWASQQSILPIDTFWCNYSFVIGNKGYFGYTYESNHLYEYNFDTHVWTQKANFPGTLRWGPACFAVGNKGYVVAGYQTSPDGPLFNFYDTWEYNPATDAWTQRASFPFPFFGRHNATGFSMYNKGYLLNGMISTPTDNISLNQLLQFDPSTNSWTAKANFPGAARAGTLVFTIGATVYAGAGRPYAADADSKDFYKYSPALDSWAQVADIPVPDQSKWEPPLFRHAFAINSSGYITWQYVADWINDRPMNIEKYTPLICSFQKTAEQ